MQPGSESQLASCVRSPFSSPSTNDPLPALFPPARLVVGRLPSFSSPSISPFSCALYPSSPSLITPAVVSSFPDCLHVLSPFVRSQRWQESTRGKSRSSPQIRHPGKLQSFVVGVRAHQRGGRRKSFPARVQFHCSPRPLAPILFPSHPLFRATYRLLHSSESSSWARHDMAQTKHVLTTVHSLTTVRRR